MICWRVGRSNLIRNKTTGPPVILHSCHVVCSASYFYGPTLRVSPCNDSDPRQQFELGVGVNSSGTLSDAGTGLCAGCLHVNTGTLRVAQATHVLHTC